MRDNSNDNTVERNYVQKWRFLISEYELVKAKKHPRFRFVQDFYNFHGTNRQTFAKYYNRFRQLGSGLSAAFYPALRGILPQPARFAKILPQSGQRLRLAAYAALAFVGEALDAGVDGVGVEVGFGYHVGLAAACQPLVVPVGRQ